MALEGRFPGQGGPLRGHSCPLNGLRTHGHPLRGISGATLLRQEQNPRPALLYTRGFSRAFTTVF